MIKNFSFFSGLKRITTSKKYIPEIDGIRFVAILMVVLHHISFFVQYKDTNIYRDQKVKMFLKTIFISGHLGVEIFFVLSGLILSMPFASNFLKNTEKPSLKKFYFRRLTRLEPPYILMITVLGITLFFMHKFSGIVLLKSYLASLTYTHLLFYPGMPILINGISWSLEVEFQFYLIAPFLCYIFSFNRAMRRIIILLCIVLLILVQSLFITQTVSLFCYLQYFLLGFLLTDLYITEDYKRVKNVFSIPIGILSIILILMMPNEKTLIPSELIVYKFYLLTVIFVFFYVAIFSPFWKKALSIPFISNIGGMCYSIYLIHFTIIIFVGNVLVREVHPSSYFLLNYFLINICLLAAILFGSILFYKKIERPCMKADWFSEFIGRIRRTNYQA